MITIDIIHFLSLINARSQTVSLVLRSWGKLNVNSFFVWLSRDPVS
jgi:hypothetical protein